MWRITTIMSGAQGGPWYSNMHFADTVGLNTQDAVDAVSDFWTVAAAAMRSGIALDSNPDVAVIDPDTGETTGNVNTTAFHLTSSSGGEALPTVAQCLVRWRTGVFVGGHEIRGRTFVPRLVEQENASGGSVEAAFMATLQAAATALINDANSSLAVYSRKHHQLEIVNASSIWNQWAILRSRRD